MNLPNSHPRFAGNSAYSGCRHPFTYRDTHRRLQKGVVAFFTVQIGQSDSLSDALVFQPLCDELDASSTFRYHCYIEQVFNINLCLI